MARVGGCLAALILVVCVQTQILLAESYRIVIGDRLQASIMGDQQPLTGTVDLDGYLRFAGLAQAHVAGKTLAEAEAALEQDLQSAELYVDPDISLAIAQHAPIMVVGEVEQPGSYKFVPMLTVELAVGLAGGRSQDDLAERDTWLQRLEIEGQLRALDIEILHQSVRVARLEAQLRGDETVSADEVDLVDTETMPQILNVRMSLEQELLDNFVAQGTHQYALWDKQLSQLDQEIVLLSRRIELQRDLVVSRLQEFENTRSLAERGLQRTPIVLAQERRVSEAQARILDLEAQKSRAQSDRIAAERAQSLFRDQRRLATLEALQNTVQEGDELRQRRENLLNKFAVVSQSLTSLRIVGEKTILNYRISRGELSGVTQFDATKDAVVLPGDAVIVSFARGNPAQEF